MKTLREQIAELERTAIDAALVATRGNQSKAAELLGIHRGTLRNRLEEYKECRRSNRS